MQSDYARPFGITENEWWNGDLVNGKAYEYQVKRELAFSPALYNETMEATRNATKPVVLLYGLDDSWTGAAVKDQYINGTNVRKFILPAQNHLVAFSSDTDKEQCDAVRTILEGILSTPQALDPVTAAPSPVTRKLLRNGQLIIMRDGHTYTVTGQQL